MGSAAPAAAAPFPGKATRIFRKGQRSNIKFNVSFKTARLFYEPVCLGGVKSASALFAFLVNSVVREHCISFDMSWAPRP